MYKIIGADQKEYGPITADQIIQWIAEGRVAAHTQARLEGSETWQPLSNFPEFAIPLGTTAGAPPTGSVNAPAATDEIIARDYQIDMGACISGGWNLLQQNFALLFCGCLIYFAIEIGIGMFGRIPIIGLLFSALNMVIAGPLLGGLYYLTLQAIRKQPASPGDVFAGFQKGFLHLFLGNLVTTILATLCFAPAGIIALIGVMPAALHHQPPPTVPLVAAIGVGLIGLIPWTFLVVSWLFTLPLVIDKGMTFWPAMQLSAKMVRRHWWQVFGLMVICGLINVGGLILCCVGVLFTMPITFGALMYAYEEIFGRKTA